MTCAKACSNYDSLYTGVTSECQAEEGCESIMTMREGRRVEAVSILYVYRTDTNIEVSKVAAQPLSEQ